MLIQLLLFVIVGAVFVSISVPVASGQLTKDTFANSNGKRLLKSFRTVDKGDGERISIPGLDAINGWMSSGVSNARIKLWLARGEDADDAFQLLKLDQGVDQLRDSTKLNTWANYVGILNVENPGKKISMAALLSAHYGDEAIAKIIEAAKKVPSTETVGNTLYRELLHGWYDTGKSPEKVFKLLNLHIGVDSMLVNPTLHTMVAYLNMFNQKNPSQHKALINIITAFHNGDAPVALALQKAISSPSTKDNALLMQGYQFDEWIKKGIKPKEMHGTIFGGTATGAENAIALQYKKYYKGAKKALEALGEV